MKLNGLYSIRYAILLVFLLCLAAPGCFQQQAMHSEDMKYPKLRDIDIPSVARVTLANGMRLLLIEDHELPTINIRAMIRTGSVYEPTDKIGLAELTDTVMRTGGTASKTGDQIDEELERVAASVETDIGLNSGYAYMWVLKENLDTGMAVLADVLMNPAFREDKIELAKIEQHRAIAERNDNMRSIAYREYKKLIYGSENVYARHTEYATIDNISRDDLVAFHKKFYRPNNVILGVWGDFNTKEMIKKIEETFKSWEKTELQLPEVSKVKYEFRPTINLVRKNDINQTAIYIGHIGGMMNDPDYFALVLMNRILGEGFTSRLFRNVRSRQGLAYSVFGRYGAEYDHPDVFYVGCQTKSATTIQAIRAMEEEVRKITEGEVTDEELAIAKGNYLNSFVFNFATKGRIVSRLMTYEYFDYPPDFLEKTKANIEKVNKEDILRVARKHLQPGKMQVLAIGKPQDFGESLSLLGPVHEIDINIPALKGK